MPHRLNGSKVQLKQAITKDQSRQKTLNEKQRKIFVTNLGDKLSQGAICTYFSQFGPVEETRIITNDEKRSRGFGFVLFRDRSSVIDVFNRGEIHTIEGHEVLSRLTLG